MFRHNPIRFRQGRRASLGIHGPDRTAGLIHYAIGVSPQVYTGYGYSRLTSQGTASGIAGGRQLTMVDSTGPQIKPDRTTLATSSRPHPHGRRRVMSEHDRVGAGSMAVRGYVPEKPATQSEGTCARVRNYLISAVVTKPGPTAQGKMLSLRRTD